MNANPTSTAHAVSTRAVTRAAGFTAFLRSKPDQVKVYLPGVSVNACAPFQAMVADRIGLDSPAHIRV